MTSAMMLESLIMVVALSIDAFVACFAYGTNEIKIPFRSVAVIDLICTVTLALSLLLGSVIRPFVPSYLTKEICFLILLVLGLVKLCDSTLKSLIRKRKKLHKKIAFSALHLNFILHVYANPEEADTDASKLLSPAEAASLAVALSLDGLAVGFGAALASVNLYAVILLSLLAGAAAVVCGCFLGNKIAQKLPFDLSWVSGILLIVLAFLKL